jgi:alcohol dehydrogenase class IV
MNALSHAIEAYVSSAASEFNNLHALEAIRLINNNFVQCLSDLNNLQFRAKMMLASLYAGLAFSNASLGCVHSMSHSLGGFLDLSHGECNAILLPHVVDFNFSSASYKYRKIAEVLNLNTLNSNDSEVKQKLINYLLNLKEKVNIKTSLKTKGVSSDLIPTLASNAINDPCNATNPRPPKRKDLETIFTQAM